MEYPAISAEALLAGFRQVGLDDVTIRKEAGVPTLTEGARLPMETWGALWQAARRRDEAPELPTRVGLSVPFGTFGMVDYLVGSALSVEGALESLAQHFSAIAAGFGLEVQRPDATRLVMTVIQFGKGVPERHDSDEFALATILGRLRTLCPTLAVTQITIGREIGNLARHIALLRAPTIDGANGWSLEIPRSSATLPLSRTDPGLHATMRAVAKQLGLTELQEAQTTVELAIRARLRDLLSTGNFEAPHVARLLGLSERSLYRKLASEGRSYQDILDDFRAAESQRLLMQRKHTHSEIASAVGFTEQSAWARAFRRWTGLSPTEWRESRNLDATANTSALSES